MNHHNLARRGFLQALAVTGGACVAVNVLAQEQLKEPVFRVSKANSVPANAGDKHPLDPALDMARGCLVRMRQYPDYTATIVKRERIKGVLGNYEYMFAKIRNRVEQDGKLVTPLSVYLHFLKPDDIKGREVIWVEGQNNGKLKAHEGGLLGRTLPSVWLPPDGILAMRGQLHPIYDIGIENLILKLIERGTRERQYDETEVKFEPGAKINGRSCTVLSVKHPVPREHFEFYLAQIFIDDEYKLPIRYAAYTWPKEQGENTVLEEYTYLDLKLNQNLTDADFDPENPNYKF